MAVDIEKIRKLVPHSEIPVADAEVIAQAWRSVVLRPGQSIWKQGDAAPDFGMLAKGELAVYVDEEEIGVILRGDVLGETAAFSTSARRSATLQAVEPGEVLLLAGEDMPRLAYALPAFHEALLDQCLQGVSKRIRATDLRIATLSRGVQPAPAPTTPSKLTRAWRTLRDRVHGVEPPDIVPLLDALPGLRNQPKAVLESIATAFVPQQFDTDEMLTIEGKATTSAFLLAEGEVQILRHVRGHMAELLAIFLPGDVFGAVTLVRPGSRTATCQAICKGWAYRMDEQAYRDLSGRVALSWKSSMLATMGIQLRNANALLAGLQSGSHDGGPLSAEEFQRLLEAAGSSSGTPGVSSARVSPRRSHPGGAATRRKHVVAGPHHSRSHRQALALELARCLPRKLHCPARRCRPAPCPPALRPPVAPRSPPGGADRWSA